MTKILLHVPLILMSLLTSSVFANVSAIDFTDISYSEALEYSTFENKLVFVNFNSVEVEPCQIMANTTFQNKDVISILNGYYVSVNADVDMPNGKKWIDRFNVECLPTMMVLDSQGKLMGINQGTLSTPAFIKWLGLIGAPNRVESFASQKKDPTVGPDNLLGLQKKMKNNTAAGYTPVDNSETVEIKIVSPLPESLEAKKNTSTFKSKTKEVENTFSFSTDEKEKSFPERVPVPKDAHLVDNSETRTMSYSIQIGAFGKYLNAKKYIEKGSQELDDHYYILEEVTAEGKRLFKVVVGAFSSKAKARITLAKLEELGYSGFLRRI